MQGVFVCFVLRISFFSVMSMQLIPFSHSLSCLGVWHIDCLLDMSVVFSLQTMETEFVWFVVLTLLQYGLFPLVN